MMVALLALAVSAGAQTYEKNWFEGLFYGGKLAPCDIYPVPGTPSELVARTAFETNSTTYTAAVLADETLLPTVERVAEERDVGTVIAVSFDHLAGVQNVPSRVINCSGRGIVDAPVDLTASRFGLAHRKNWWGIFYAVSVNGYGVHARPMSRFTAPWLMYGLTTSYAFVAPFFPKGYTDGQRFVLAWDWIGGFEAQPGHFDARLGYIGSQGLYFNAAEDRTRLFLRGMLKAAPETPGLGAPLVSAGIEEIPYADDLKETIGRMGLFARHMTQYTQVEDNPFVPEGYVAAIDLRTAHFQQVGIAKQVDVRVALAAKPSPLVHEALVGWHSPDFDLTRTEEREGGGVAVLGGIVSTAPAWHYDVSPGYKPSISLVAGGSDREGHFDVALRYNPPDTIDIHPYTVGALSFELNFAMTPE